MARGGSRYGAGRPGWKLKAEQSLPLDIRKMHRAGVLRDWYVGGWRWTDSYSGEQCASIGLRTERDSLTLNYSTGGEPRKQHVRIDRTRCHFGGERPWFICPVRGERVAVLYMRAGRFACRHCQRIAYLSQSDDVVGSAWRKQRKVEAKLGPNYRRPKGMHDTTHEHLLSLIARCEETKDLALEASLARMRYMV